MTQLSLECELSFGSWLIGRPRTCGTVASRTPVRMAGAGFECSMMMTIVGPERDSEGCWNGFTLTPRVTIRRAWTLIGHGVGRRRPVQRGEDAGAVHADVDADGAAGGEEAVEVIVEEHPFAVVEPQPLPHAVAEQEAGIVDRDGRLGTRLQFTVHPDQDIVVARIVLGVVGRRLFVLHAGN